MTYKITRDRAPFVSPCPPPTPHERELLTILIEECMEVAQRATKMLRFGVEEIQPGQSLTNAERLALEFGDLREIALCVEGIGMMPTDFVSAGMIRKCDQLDKYLQTTPETKE